MLFNSPAFLFEYLPIVVAGFLLLGWLGWRDAAVIWLSGASLAFYGWDNPKRLLPVIVGSILFNYAVGRALMRWPSGKWLFAGVAGNLLLLGYYKYTNFLLGSLAGLEGVPAPTLHILLPIGISFFTFTQIAFLVDVYGGKVREYRPHHYVLFVTFFPHLIAGPILHHSEMMPQFEEKRTYRFNPALFALGLTWFAAGLFKKTILADGVSAFVGPVFSAADGSPPPGFADAWLGALSYTMQIYFDFSGYCDMAIGLSYLMGIKLPLNFNSPYQAESMIDFWRRWHMTLSRFLRDYLYIPLGGNRKGHLRRYTNLMVTMLLGGLWHGAAWNFVVWGGIHGAGLAVNHLWRHGAQVRGWYLPKVIGRAITLLVVVLAWVAFRADTLHDTLVIWRAMAGFSGYGPQPGVLGAACVLWLVALSGIALFLPNTQAILRDGQAGGGWLAQRLQWKPQWGWAAGMGAVFGAGIAAVLLNSGGSEFIYFRF